jgi:hypothetical protein
MPDRTSTLRFKAEGLDQVGADIRRFLAQYRTQMAQANKLFAEGLTGERAGVDPAKLKDTYDKGVAYYISADTKRRQFEAASWETTKKQYAEQAKSKKEHDKLVVEDEKAQLAKFYAEERATQAQFKKEVREIKEKEKKEAVEVKDRKQAIAEMDKIDADFSNVTTTRQQKEVAKLEQTWTRKRQLYKGNTDAIARIDAEAIVARNRIDAKYAKGGGRDEESLSGFGGKMVLGHAIGQFGGEIIGDTHVGQLLGSVVSSAMFGGPVVGAAVAGLAVVGSAIRVHRENVQETQKASQAYAASVRDLTSAWAGLAITLANYGTFGNAMTKEMERASASTAKLGMEMGQLTTQGNANSEWGAVTRYTLNDFMSGMLGEKSTKEIGMESVRRQAGLQKYAREKAEEFRTQEAPLYIADQKKLLSVQQSMIPVAGMRSGLLKQELELKGKISSQDVTRASQQRQELAQAEKTADIAEELQKRLEAEFKRKLGAKEDVVGIRWELDAATQSATEARNAANRMPGQHAAQNASAVAENQRQVESFESSKREVFVQAQYKTNQEIIRATTLGYEQQQQLQNLADQKELRDAIDSNVELGQVTLDGIQARFAAKKKEHDMEVAQIAGQAFQAEVAAGTDKYHRERAVKYAGYQEELRQADLLNDPAKKAAVQRKVDASLAADRRADQEQEQVRTDQAVISARYRGYAQQKELREYAWREELKFAEAKGDKELALVKTRIDAERSVEQRANQERAQEAMASFDPSSAVSVLKRKTDDYKAMGYSDQQVKALKDEELTGQLRRQIQHNKIDLAVKGRRINQMEADVLNAMVESPLARSKTEEGRQVRKALVEEAATKEMLRGADPIRVGEFTTKYQAGFVDLSRVNLDRQLDQRGLQQRANAMAERMMVALEKMAENGGLG